MGKSISMEPNQIIKLAAEAGARAALEALEKEKMKSIKQHHDRRLRNTKTLMKNYRMFKDHIDCAVYETSQLDESAIDILDLMGSGTGGEVIVESIKKSVARTRVIMTHINDMLGLYDTYCARSGKPEDKRRWRVLCAMYVDNEVLTADEIAKTELIDKRTVYRDIDDGIEKLSALIFGIDGMHQ